MEPAVMEQEAETRQLSDSNNSFTVRYDDTPRFLDQDIATTAQSNLLSDDNRNIFNGWRLGAFCSALLAVVSLLVNTGLAIWIGKYSTSNNDGLLQLYEGDCDRVRSMGIWLHLAINAMSTLLLGGSNYCMQCLSSPTRREIDKMHAFGAFLDIGVVSMRNLGSMSRWKISMWWVLAVSSVPLHLLYNSTFYGMITNNQYDVFLANHTLIDRGVNFTTKVSGRTINQMNIADLNVINNGSSGDFYRLERADCIREYARTILTNRRNLLLVTGNVSGVAVDGLHYLHTQRLARYDAQSMPFNWLCCSDPWIKSKTGLSFYPSFQSNNDYNQTLNLYPNFTSDDPIPDLSSCGFPGGATCERNIVKIETLADEWTPYQYRVDYCLSEQVKEICTLNGNLNIIVVVIACNAVKALIMFIVAFGLRDHPLITIGDAIESFLEVPDHTTKGRCWMGEADFIREGWSTNPFRKQQQPELLRMPRAALLTFRRQRWWSAISLIRWLTAIAVLTLTLSMSSALLITGILVIKRYSKTIQQIGFGRMEIAATIATWSINNYHHPTQQILASILVANTPQLILSMLYYNVNGILTRMWLAAEWADFAKVRQYLRVSSPKGNQRSTHFLHLPYRVSLSLLVVSTLLHWLLSQSIFLVAISDRTSFGEPNSYVVTCGFSPMAIILTIALGFCLLLVLILLGYRYLGPGIPRAGPCSAAISAACHPPRSDDKASLERVQYGAIPGYNVGGSIGHCSFTSGEVETPTVGKLYAGLQE